jgi:hypothetical protein
MILKNTLFNYKIKIMKLSLDSLKERTKAIVTEGLLSSISGGTEASCHLDDFYNPPPKPGDIGPINDSNDPWVH